MCREIGMIKPFEPRLVREVEGRRIISAGVSSYGYDLRLEPDGFRVLRPIASAEIDPKNSTRTRLSKLHCARPKTARITWLLPPPLLCAGRDGRNIQYAAQCCGHMFRKEYRMRAAD